MTEVRIYHRASGLFGDADSGGAIHLDKLEIGDDDESSSSRSLEEHVSLPQHLMKIPKKFVQIIVPWDRSPLQDDDSGLHFFPGPVRHLGKKLRHIVIRNPNHEVGSEDTRSETHDTMDGPTTLPGHFFRISKKIFFLVVPIRRAGRHLELADTASETVYGDDHDDDVASRHASLPIRLLQMPIKALQMPIKVLQVIVRSPGGRRQLGHENYARSDSAGNIEMVYSPNQSPGRLRRIGNRIRHIVVRRSKDPLDMLNSVYDDFEIVNRESINFDPLTLSERVKRSSKRLSAIATHNPKILSPEILGMIAKGMEEQFQLAKEMIVENTNKIGLSKRRYASRLRRRISSRFLKEEDPPRIIKKLEHDALRAYYAYHKGLIPCLKTLIGENPRALKFVLNARKEDTKSEAWRLKDGTSEFLNTANNYLDCRAKLDAKYDEVDEFHRIAKFIVSTDSGGIQAEDTIDPNVFKAEYQQQSVSGKPVETLDELYEAATKCQPVYEKLIRYLVARVSQACNVDESSVDLKIMPLKSRQRSVNKSNDDYKDRVPGPPVSWLYDIVRGSIRFSTADQVLKCLEIMKEDASIHVVKAKNRYAILYCVVQDVGWS